MFLLTWIEKLYLGSMMTSFIMFIIISYIVYDYDYIIYKGLDISRKVLLFSLFIFSIANILSIISIIYMLNHSLI